MERRPIVLKDGRLQELPLGDSLPSGSSGDDFLSSYYFIDAAQSLLIPQYKQMIVVDSLEVSGTLEIGGQLCLI
jgi:hypothetical protein